jgi:cobalt-zinc-cadmium efflux system outer membrane protein
MHFCENVMVRKLQLYIIAVVLCVCAFYRTAQAGNDDAQDFLEADLLSATQEDAASWQPEIRRLLEKDEISLDDLLRAALLCSPVIAAAQNEIGAATGRFHQAGLYPNPTIKFEAEDIPAGDVDFSRNQNKISFIQPIILGKRRSAAVAAAAAEREARSFTMQNTVFEVLCNVRLAYVELLFARSSVDLHENVLVIARRTLQIAQIRFDALAAFESELIKAQIKVHELELGKRKQTRQIASATQSLQSIFQDAQLSADRIVGDLTMTLPSFNLEQLLAAVCRRHPLILAAQKTVEAAENRFKHAKAERIPDVSFRGSFGRNTANGENIIEAGISIPLPLFNRNQGRITETRNLATRARNEARVCAARLSADITAAHTSYMAARDDVAVSSKQILPATRRAFLNAQERYRAGRGNLHDLLNAQEILIDVQLSQLVAVRDLNSSFALLHRAAGMAIKVE